jgi:hypothetical protein
MTSMSAVRVWNRRLSDYEGGFIHSFIHLFIHIPVVSSGAYGIRETLRFNLVS